MSYVYRWLSMPTCMSSVFVEKACFVASAVMKLPCNAHPGSVHALGTSGVCSDGRVRLDLCSFTHGFAQVCRTRISAWLVLSACGPLSLRVVAISTSSNATYANYWEIDWLSLVLDCSNALQWSAPEIYTLQLLEREKARQEVWEREIWGEFKKERVVVGTCMHCFGKVRWRVWVFKLSMSWNGLTRERCAVCNCYNSAVPWLQIELFIGGANVSIVWKSLEVGVSASLFSYLS